MRNKNGLIPREKTLKDDLVFAIEQKQPSADVRKIIYSGKNGKIALDLNSPDEYGRTALQVLAKETWKNSDEYYKTLNLLLEAGANPNGTGKNINWIPLMYFVENGDVKGLDLCLKHGGDIKRKQYGEFNMLHIVVKGGKPKPGMIQKLISLGISPNETASLSDNEKTVRTIRTPLSMLLNGFKGKNENQLQCLQILLENMSNEALQLKDAKGNNYLHILCDCNYVSKKAVDILLKKAPELIDQKNDKGKTPLWLLCENSKDLPAIKALLKAGASPNLFDAERLLFSHEIDIDSLDFLKLLVKCGLDINQKSNFFLQQDLLSQFIWRIDESMHNKLKQAELVKMIEFLIDNGADLNSKDCNNFTPLLMLLTQESIDITPIASKLLWAGADITIKSNEHSGVEDFLKKYCNEIKNKILDIIKEVELTKQQNSVIMEECNFSI